MDIHRFNAAARGLPTHLQLLNTFRQWDIQIDESFFMGGVSKVGVLSAFQPHIYFDDQEPHCQDAAQVVSTGKVPLPIQCPSSPEARGIEIA